MMQIKRIVILFFIRAFVPLMAQPMDIRITLEDVYTAATYYRSQCAYKKTYRTTAYALGGITLAAGMYMLYRKYMCKPDVLKPLEERAQPDDFINEKDLMVIADYIHREHIHREKSFKDVITDSIHVAIYSAFAMFFTGAMYQGWGYIVHGWRKLHTFLHTEDQAYAIQQAMLTAGNVIVETLQRYQKHLVTYGTDESIMISSHRDFLAHEIIEQHRAYVHMLIDCLGLMCVLYEKNAARLGYDMHTWRERLISIIDLNNTYLNIIEQDMARVNQSHTVDAVTHMIFTAEQWFDQLMYRLAILNT